MSIVRIIMLLALTSFLANCSMFCKSEEEEQAEIARFKDYYPSDVYTEIAGEDDGASERSPASYEDDNYQAADEDPAESRNDEQSAYLDKSLEQEDDMEKGKDNLPVENAQELAAVDMDGIEDAP
ncbi:MAG: hypothetical protein HRT44_13245, partial [Bdellovibrionales bacterium]|nr:hypothetical protein [Bdellovibrionales bacterium]NQZ20203.1 hypothetical protein [Bdellovibrionales bacterium]